VGVGGGAAGLARVFLLVCFEGGTARKGRTRARAEGEWALPTLWRRSGPGGRAPRVCDCAAARARARHRPAPRARRRQQNRPPSLFSRPNLCPARPAQCAGGPGSMAGGELRSRRIRPAAEAGMGALQLRARAARRERGEKRARKGAGLSLSLPFYSVPRPPALSSCPFPRAFAPLGATAPQSSACIRGTGRRTALRQGRRAGRPPFADSAASAAVCLSACPPSFTLPLLGKARRCPGGDLGARGTIRRRMGAGAGRRGRAPLGETGKGARGKDFVAALPLFRCAAKQQSRRRVQ
jgi:hypothetical protein